MARRKSDILSLESRLGPAEIKTCSRRRLCGRAPNRPVHAAPLRREMSPLLYENIMATFTGKTTAAFLGLGS